MKNKLLIRSLILSFLLFANLLYGQTNMQKDSLLKVIPTLEGKDKLNAFQQLARACGKNDELQKNTWRNYIIEAEKQKNIEQVAYGKLYLANCYYTDYRSDSILIYAKEAEKYCIDNKQLPIYYRTRQIIVNQYLNKGLSIIAMDEAQKTYQTAKELQASPAEMANVLYILGNVCLQMKTTDQAIQYYKEALSLLGDNFSPNSLNIYMELCKMIFPLYMEQKKIKDALTYIDKYKKGLDKMDPDIIKDAHYFDCEGAYTQCYLQLGDMKKAKSHFEKMQKLYDPTWSPLQGFIRKIQTECVYYYHNKEYDKSLAACDKTLDFYVKNRLDGMVPIAMRKKAEILDKMGNYKQASALFNKTITISDSLYSVELDKNINQLTVFYELDKAEMQVKQHELSIQAQRNMIAGLIVSSLLFLIIGILIYIYSRQLRAKNHILYKQIQEQDKLEEEIEEKNTYIYQNSTDSELIRNSKLFAALKELMKDETIYTQADIDRKSIAEMLNTNEKYLFDSIKENAGLSFSEYINSLRLNLAKKLLSDNNNFTIEDIAIRSGFGSRTTFHRQFREKYQLSPAEFRKVALTEKRKL